jgi:hypothetical protein
VSAQVLADTCHCDQTSWRFEGSSGNATACNCTVDRSFGVSDVPLDAKALSDPFVRGDLADAGKLHAFEITIDATGTPISTVWRDNGFKGPMPSGLSSADPFHLRQGFGGQVTKTVLDGKVVEGRYKSAEEAEFFGNTYSFDVTFRAVIAH